jgi:hypothetical protein
MLGLQYRPVPLNSGPKNDLPQISNISGTKRQKGVGLQGFFSLTYCIISH